MQNGVLIATLQRIDTSHPTKKVYVKLSLGDQVTKTKRDAKQSGKSIEFNARFTFLVGNAAEEILMLQSYVHHTFRKDNPEGNPASIPLSELAQMGGEVHTIEVPLFPGTGVVQLQLTEDVSKYEEPYIPHKMELSDGDIKHCERSLKRPLAGTFHCWVSAKLPSEDKHHKKIAVVTDSTIHICKTGGACTAICLLTITQIVQERQFITIKYRHIQYGVPSAHESELVLTGLGSHVDEEVAVLRLLIVAVTVSIMPLRSLFPAAFQPRVHSEPPAVSLPWLLSDEQGIHLSKVPATDLSPLVALMGKLYRCLTTNTTNVSNRLSELLTNVVGRQTVEVDALQLQDREMMIAVLWLLMVDCSVTGWDLRSLDAAVVSFFPLLFRCVQAPLMKLCLRDLVLNDCGLGNALAANPANPPIHHLELVNCTLGGPAAAQLLTKDCFPVAMQYLQITCCLLESAGIQQLASLLTTDLSMLTTLDICDNILPTIDPLIPVIDAAPKLQVVRVRGCKSNIVGFLQAVLRRVQNPQMNTLQTVDISGNRLGGEPGATALTQLLSMAPKLVPSLGDLQDLDLPAIGMLMKAIDTNSNDKNLKAVYTDIDLAQDQSPEAIVGVLSALKRTVELNMSGCIFHPNVLTWLVNAFRANTAAPCITDLNLNFQPKLVPEFVAVVEHNNSLQALHIAAAGDGRANQFYHENMPVVSQIAAKLEGNVRLTTLDIRGWRGGDPLGIALGTALRRNRTLTELHFTGNHLGLYGIQAFRGCLYGNKKLANVSPLDSDVQQWVDKQNEIKSAARSDEAAAKRGIKLACKPPKNFTRKANELEKLRTAKRTQGKVDRETEKMQTLYTAIRQAIGGNAVIYNAKVAEKNAKLEAKQQAQAVKDQVKEVSRLQKEQEKLEKARIKAEEKQETDRQKEEERKAKEGERKGGKSTAPQPHIKADALRSAVLADKKKETVVAATAVVHNKKFDQMIQKNPDKFFIPIAEAEAKCREMLNQQLSSRDTMLQKIATAPHPPQREVPTPSAPPLPSYEGPPVQGQVVPNQSAAAITVGIPHCYAPLIVPPDHQLTKEQEVYNLYIQCYNSSLPPNPIVSHEPPPPLGVAQGSMMAQTPTGATAPTAPIPSAPPPPLLPSAPPMPHDGGGGQQQQAIHPSLTVVVPTHWTSLEAVYNTWCKQTTFTPTTVNWSTLPLVNGDVGKVVDIFLPSLAVYEQTVALLQTNNMGFLWVANDMLPIRINGWPVVASSTGQRGVAGVGGVPQQQQQEGQPQDLYYLPKAPEGYVLNYPAFANANHLQTPSQHKSGMEQKKEKWGEEKYVDWKKKYKKEKKKKKYWKTKSHHNGGWGGGYSGGGYYGMYPWWDPYPYWYDPNPWWWDPCDPYPWWDPNPFDRWDCEWREDCRGNIDGWDGWCDGSDRFDELMMDNIVMDEIEVDRWNDWVTDQQIPDMEELQLDQLMGECDAMGDDSLGVDVMMDEIQNDIACGDYMDAELDMEDMQDFIDMQAAGDDPETCDDDGLEMDMYAGMDPPPPRPPQPPRDSNKPVPIGEFNKPKRCGGDNKAQQPPKRQPVELHPLIPHRDWLEGDIPKWFTKQREKEIVHYYSQFENFSLPKTDTVLIQPDAAFFCIHNRLKQHQQSTTTIVTQCSIDRLGALTRLALSITNHYLSVSVYVPSNHHDMIHNVSNYMRGIQSIVHCQGTSCMSTTLVINKGDIDAPYPVNLMRNVALHYAVNTDTVLLLDVDFVLSNDASRMIAASIHKLRENNMNAYVLPAFEYLDDAQHMGRSYITLRDQWQKGQAVGFHVDRYPKGHSTTDYEQWWTVSTNDNTSDPYPIQYTDCYEPYVLVHKNSIPQYDERFVGYGLNKISHIYHMAHCGLQFYVLPPPCFVICGQHEPSKDYHATFGPQRDPNLRLKIEALWNKFRAELRLRALDGPHHDKKYQPNVTTKHPDAVLCIHGSLVQKNDIVVDGAMYDALNSEMDASCMLFKHQVVSAENTMCLCGKSVFSASTFCAGVKEMNENRSAGLDSGVPNFVC